MHLLVVSVVCRWWVCVVGAWKVGAACRLICCVFDGGGG